MTDSTATAQQMLREIEDLQRQDQRQRAKSLSLHGMLLYPDIEAEHRRPVFLGSYVQLLLQDGDIEFARKFMADYSNGNLPVWWRLMLARDAARCGRVAEAITEYRFINQVDPAAKEPFDTLAYLARHHRSTEAAQALVELFGGRTSLQPNVAADLAWQFSQWGDHDPAAALDIGAHGMRCKIIQTSDSEIYFDMAMTTLEVNRRYARRMGASYEMFIGVQRGFYPWHATFNRIPWLRQMLTNGYYGWVLYLDADAYVADLTFDLWHYLESKKDMALVAASASGAGKWDINIGVLLLNLGDARTRRILELWEEAFTRILQPSVLMRAVRPFEDIPNDQSILHAILRDNDDLCAGLHVEDNRLLNSYHASFIRQHLRASRQDFAERMKDVREGVQRSLAADPASP